MMYSCRRFYISGFSGSLIITIEPKTEYRCRAADMFSFQSAKDACLNISCIFFKDLIAHITIFLDESGGGSQNSTDHILTRILFCGL
jgi:hypothetical protein